MRRWILKCAGFILWSLFLFLPFIARADSGFDVYLPLSMPVAVTKDKSNSDLPGGYDLWLGEKGAYQALPENKWSLKLEAGKDTVLTNDFAPEVQHDRLPLDDGERKSLRFGVGLNYRF